VWRHVLRQRVRLDRTKPSIAAPMNGTGAKVAIRALLGPTRG
jgi:hypothetical protein